ncbi:MAG: transglutaminase-like domain-containing protein, partial [Dehalococcoidia bacterium]
PLSQDEKDLWLDFLVETPLTAAGHDVRRLAQKAAAGQRTVSGVVRTLAGRVAASLRYETGITGVETTAENALAQAVGVCQDYTHLFLSACRVLEIPARYVSGYLCTEVSGDQRQQSHAWPEALLPKAGWVEFDPTNNRMVDERYVRVAVGRDYSDVPPVRGAYSGPSGNGLDVSVYVMNAEQQQQ